MFFPECSFQPLLGGARNQNHWRGLLTGEQLRQGWGRESMQIQCWGALDNDPNSLGFRLAPVKQWLEGRLSLHTRSLRWLVPTVVVVIIITVISDLTAASTLIVKKLGEQGGEKQFPSFRESDPVGRGESGSSHFGACPSTNTADSIPG